MSFRTVFLAVFAGTALIVAALIVNARRPAVERLQPSPELIRASGRCAECHRRETPAVVAEYERSGHARGGVTCLDCHTPAKGQSGIEHRGFTIAGGLSSANCRACHARQYEEYVRSRHAAPAWAAVRRRTARIRRSPSPSSTTRAPCAAHRTRSRCWKGPAPAPAAVSPATTWDGRIRTAASARAPTATPGTSPLSPSPASPRRAASVP